MSTDHQHAPVASPTGKALLAGMIPVVAASALLAPAAFGASAAQAAPVTQAAAGQEAAPLDAGAQAASAAPAALAPRISHYSGRGITVRGGSWLKGRGVSVIKGRQCVELATRLYSSKGWGTLNNIYSTHGGRSFDNGKLKFHRNGSGYVPKPGDVLVEHGGSYGHVAVVNRVVGKKIYTMEQNAAPSGVHVYSWNGKKASGAYGSRHVGGFIHSKRNHVEDQANLRKRR